MLSPLPPLPPASPRPPRIYIATPPNQCFQEQEALVLSMVKRSFPPLDVSARKTEIDQQNRAGKGGGVFYWLAARGGLLQDEGEGEVTDGIGFPSSSSCVLASEESLFRVALSSLPWEVSVRWSNYEASHASMM